MFVLMLLDVLNSYQDLLYDYPTTQSLGDYIIRQFIESVIGPFFIAVGFVLPALAGESLRYEVSSEKKNRGIFKHAFIFFLFDQYSPSNFYRIYRGGSDFRERRHLFLIWVLNIAEFGMSYRG